MKHFAVRYRLSQEATTAILSSLSPRAQTTRGAAKLARASRARTKKLSRYLVVGILAVALAAAVIVLTAAGNGPPGFPEASNSDLAGGGIQLGQPAALTGGVTQAQAERIALSSAAPRGSQIRGSLLARLHFVANSSVDCTCWVVSVTPPGGKDAFSGPPTTGARSIWFVKYFLIFIDAQTGRFVFSREAGSPSVPAG